ncbi:MAG: DUF2306 domain-containing protein [Burkholderiales bacterium]|nr:DUF2306 domain-containing protein [Burkholderiales bacterium]
MHALTPVVLLHLVAAVLALGIGALNLARRKGTRAHRVLGWIWVALMASAALSSFWIFGLRDGAGPSLVHLLSVWTLVSLACAIAFIRRGNVRAHKAFMIGTFAGLAGAGLGALAPGRLLAQWLFA